MHVQGLDPAEVPLNSTELRDQARLAILRKDTKNALKFAIKAEKMEPEHPHTPLAIAILKQVMFAHERKP